MTLTSFQTDLIAQRLRAHRDFRHNNNDAFRYIADVTEDESARVLTRVHSPCVVCGVSVAVLCNGDTCEVSREYNGLEGGSDVMLT